MNKKISQILVKHLKNNKISSYLLNIIPDNIFFKIWLISISGFFVTPFLKYLIGTDLLNFLSYGLFAFCGIIGFLGWFIKLLSLFFKREKKEFLKSLKLSGLVFGFFLLLMTVWIFSFSTEQDNQSKYESNSSQGEIEISSKLSDEKKGGSYLLNESLFGQSYDVEDNNFDEGAYELITYNKFVDMISSHFESKKDIDFKGLSIFNSSYKIVFPTDGDISNINNKQRDILFDAVGDKKVSDAFSEVLVVEINQIPIYFFIQEQIVSELKKDWLNNSVVNLYVFMPFTNHYDNYVPLLVNGSSLPVSKDNNQKPKQSIINIDEKSHCWVEKNGSFEMTSKECLELHDKNPFEFQVKAYQFCLEGKNPVVGDVGDKESRKQECSRLTGIKEK